MPAKKLTPYGRGNANGLLIFLILCGFVMTAGIILLFRPVREQLPETLRKILVWLMVVWTVGIYAVFKGIREELPQPVRKPFFWLGIFVCIFLLALWLYFIFIVLPGVDWRGFS